MIDKIWNEIPLFEALLKTGNLKKSHTALFVFSIVGSKQNAGSLLTPVSDTVFHDLSHGTLGFFVHGSFENHSF